MSTEKFYPIHVAICVCTCLRPKMLEACLRSLGEQAVSPDVQASIIVIDNDPAGSARAAVTDYATVAPFPVRYIHEPRRGIAIARNAALDAAIGADWIAFIDDDEMADPDWLAQLMAPTSAVFCRSTSTILRQASPLPRSCALARRRQARRSAHGCAV